MKLIYLTAIIFVVFIQVMAQLKVQPVVDAEHRFATLAAKKGTKTAFLANLDDAGVVFNPAMENGKAVWSARSESKSLLSWAPNYADISTDGSLVTLQGIGNIEKLKRKRRLRLVSLSRFGNVRRTANISLF